MQGIRCEISSIPCWEVVWFEENSYYRLILSENREFILFECICVSLFAYLYVCVCVCECACVSLCVCMHVCQFNLIGNMGGGDQSINNNVGKIVHFCRLAWSNANPNSSCKIMNWLENIELTWKLLTV